MVSPASSYARITDTKVGLSIQLFSRYRPYFWQHITYAFVAQVSISHPTEYDPRLCVAVVSSELQCLLLDRRAVMHISVVVGNTRQ
jgi:hypothetical protein